MSTHVCISPESGPSSFCELEDLLAEDGFLHESPSRVFDSPGNVMTISKVAHPCTLPVHLVFPLQIMFCELAVNHIPVRLPCFEDV